MKITLNKSSDKKKERNAVLNFHHLKLKSPKVTGSQSYCANSYSLLNGVTGHLLVDLPMNLFGGRGGCGHYYVAVVLCLFGVVLMSVIE